MTQPFTFTAILDNGKVEAEVEVTYTVNRYYAATMEQPAEGGEIEIQSVTLNGAPFATTQAEDDYLIEQAGARAGEDVADEASAREEYFADQARDRRMERESEA